MHPGGSWKRLLQMQLSASHPCSPGQRDVALTMSQPSSTDILLCGVLKVSTSEGFQSSSGVLHASFKQNHENIIDATVHRLAAGTISRLG